MPCRELLFGQIRSDLPDLVKQRGEVFATGQRIHQSDSQRGNPVDFGECNIKVFALHKFLPNRSLKNGQPLRRHLLHGGGNVTETINVGLGRQYRQEVVAVGDQLMEFSG